MENKLYHVIAISDTKNIVENLDFIQLTAGLNYKQLLLILKLVNDINKDTKEFKRYKFKKEEIAEIYTINKYDKKSLKSIDVMLDELF